MNTRRAQRWLPTSVSGAATASSFIRTSTLIKNTESVKLATTCSTVTVLLCRCRCPLHVQFAVRRQALGNTKRHGSLSPDGFYAGRRNNGKAAGPYVQRVSNLMKSALLPSNVTESSQITAQGDAVPMIAPETCSMSMKVINVPEHPGFYIQLEGEGRGQLVKAQKDRRKRWRPYHWATSRRLILCT